MADPWHHYAKAEHLLNRAATDDNLDGEAMQLVLQMAQVHATLATVRGEPVPVPVPSRHLVPG